MIRIIVSILLALALSTSAFASSDWSRTELLFAQKELNALGYNAGSPDGIWGKKTETALKLFFENQQKSTTNFQFFKDILQELNQEKTAHLDIILDERAAIRFENRIGIGAPEHRVKRYVGKTRREAIQIVVKELYQHSDLFTDPPWLGELLPLGIKDEVLQHVLPRNECNVEWFQKSTEFEWIKTALETETPQFDRLALFWLDHFSVQYSQYVEPHAYVKHINFARNWYQRNLTELLKEGLVDPSNIVFLNNDRNHKNLQNENLAREFLELYSLGEGNYTEKDVRELAKLITGLSYNKNTEKYWYSSKLNYKGSVKIFGSKIENLDQFFLLLESHENYGDFIIEKYFNEYIALGEPPEDFITSIKPQFRNSDFDLVKLFELIISSKDFWGEETVLNLVKSPFEIMVGTARTLNSSGSIPYDFRFINRLTKAMSEMNQNLTEPPNIEGWKTGLEWLDGNQLTLRADLLYKIFSKDSLNPQGISKSQAAAAWKSYKKTLEYENKLKKFYQSHEEDQISLETIHFDFAKNRFASSQWSSMNFILIGAKLDNLPKMDIGFQLIYDPAYGNRIEFIEQNTHPDLFAPQHYKGERAEQTLEIRFPLRSNAGYLNLSNTEKRRLRLILEASKLVLDEHNRDHFLDLTAPAEYRALQWFLKLHKLKNIEDYKQADNQTVNMFSTIDPWDWREKANLLKYEKKLCRIQKYENLNLVDSHLAAVPEEDTRRYRIFFNQARRVNSKFSLSELLLPDIEVQIADNEFTEILVSEAYNLK